MSMRRKPRLEKEREARTGAVLWRSATCPAAYADALVHAAKSGETVYLFTIFNLGEPRQLHRICPNTAIMAIATYLDHVLAEARRVRATRARPLRRFERWLLRWMLYSAPTWALGIRCPDGRRFIYLLTAGYRPCDKSQGWLELTERNLEAGVLDISSEQDLGDGCARFFVGLVDFLEPDQYFSNLVRLWLSDESSPRAADDRPRESL